MPNYLISVNSHRIDSNSFPTEAEAIARALECARGLNRSVSVYRAEFAGADTQSATWPAVQRPFVHIALVSPNGSVRLGEHPAVELLDANPESGEYQDYHYAIGKLSRLVATLDDAALDPELNRKGHAIKIFAAADGVQERIQQFKAQIAAAKVAKAAAKKESDDHDGMFAIFHTPGRAFINATTKLAIKGFRSGVVSFTVQKLGAPEATVVRKAKATSLAKFLLKGDYSLGTAPVESTMLAPQGPGASKADTPASPDPKPMLQPVVKSREDSAKVLKPLETTKVLQSVIDTTTGSKGFVTLLSYCMDLCDQNLDVADELATAVANTVGPKAQPRLVAGLKAMTRFKGFELGSSWYEIAKAAALRQGPESRASTRAQSLNCINLVPPSEVSGAARSALKADVSGTKLSKLTAQHARKLAEGGALDLKSLERMQLQLTQIYARRNPAGVDPVTASAWGGPAGYNWLTLLDSNLETLTRKSRP